MLVLKLMPMEGGPMENDTLGKKRTADMVVNG